MVKQRNKKSTCQYRRCKKCGFSPWGRKVPFPWSRKWQPTSVFLPGKFYAQRSLASYSPGVAESDMTEQLGTSKRC